MRGVDIMVGLKSQVEEVFLHFLLISWVLGGRVYLLVHGR